MFSFLKSKPAPLDPQLVQKGNDSSNAITVTVPKYRVKGNYVEYVVECTRMNRTWQVSRRYQQFKSLHSQLSALCGMGTPYHCDLGVVPVLCASSWTEVTNQSPELVERRKRFLQVYLQQLLVPTNLFYVAKTALYNFLHDGEVTVVYKSRAQAPLIGMTAIAEKKKDDEEDSEEDKEEPQTSQILAATSAKLKSPEEVVAASIPDFSAGGPSKTFGGGEKLKTDSSKHFDPQAKTQTSTEEKEGGAKEKCKACGELTAVDYELELWQEYGRCNKCGKFGPHELILPPDPPREQSEAAVGLPPVEGELDDDGGEENDHDNMDEQTAANIRSAEEEEERRLEDEDNQVRERPVIPGIRQAGNDSTPQARDPRPEDNGTGPLSPNPTGSPSMNPAASPVDVPRLVERLEMGSVIPEDFDLITTLGRGTFGKVMKVCLRKTGEVFAMKVLSKSNIYKRRMIEYIKEEKAIMSLLPRHPFICYLHYAFQTLEHVYFVMDYLPGGELYAHIYPNKTLTETEARFYIAECVLALEHIHRHDVVHRDIKPENIVLDRQGHLKLTDFGLARKDFSRVRRRSFVGSAEYLAPETIQGDVQTKALDWWSVGVMLYEMLSGAAPFHAATNNDVYQAVLHKTLDFNRPCFSKTAQSLLSQLLEKDPQRRLTSPSAIKKHPFFAGLDWDKLLRCEIPPPFVPDLGVNDTKYFHRDFTSEWATIPEAAGSTRQTLEILTRRFSNFCIAKDQRSANRRSVPNPSGSPAPPPAIAGSSDDSMFNRQTSVEGGPLPDLIDPNKFTGVWRLLTVEWVSEDKKVAFPWGSEVAGMLVYSKNGLFAMQVTPIKRRKFRNPSSEKISKDEMAEAYCTYGAMFGHYEVHPGRNYITHHVNSGLCPNLSGASQKRYFTFTENTLTLTSVQAEVGEGIKARFRLTWEKSASSTELQ